MGSILGATGDGPQQTAFTASLPVRGGRPRWGDVRIPEDVQDAETEAPSLGHLTRQGLPLVISREPTAQGTSQAPRSEGPVSGGGLGSGSVRQRGAGGVDPLRSQRHRRGHHCGCTGEPGGPNISESEDALHVGVYSKQLLERFKETEGCLCLAVGPGRAPSSRLYASSYPDTRPWDPGQTLRTQAQ